MDALDRDQALDDYIRTHISPEPTHLADLYRHTHLTRLYPRMCCGHTQGRLLKMLVDMAHPRRVLELGTFSGYSALCLAEGLADDDCRVHTVEIDDEAEPALRRLFDTAPFGRRITLHIGDALTVVPAITTEPWDMVLIDANKRHYADYYRMLRPLVRPGGYILADNTLWSGKVIDPDEHDAQTIGIRQFNDLVAADNTIDTVILPLRDGMTIIKTH